MNIERFNDMGCEDLKLSIEEVSGLCRLYLDGRLDRDEESYLAAVLTTGSYDSELTDETLFLMGISRTIASRSKNVSDRIGIGRCLRKITASCGVAASLIAIVSFAWNYFDGFYNNPDATYEVYVDGKKIEDPEQCKIMALQAYNESRRFTAMMRETGRAELNEAEKMCRENEEICKISLSMNNRYINN